MYSVISIHELTADELMRAPKGLRRSSIESRYTRKSEALEEFEYQKYFQSRLGFNDRLELRRDGKVLLTNEVDHVRETGK